jgi:glycosyltransferase involved in cell wall biosynthesis
MKLVICTPTRHKPHPAYLKALEATVPLLDAAGIEHQAVFEIGCPYVSNARATMTKKALDAKADVLVYIDDDMSWEPQALLDLVRVDEPVVAGTYRFRKDEESYMGTIRSDGHNRPIVRADGLISAEWVPAGFLKVTAAAVLEFMLAYPELVYGPTLKRSVDLFNHGAYNGLWYGEDYAFSRRWAAKCGQIWILPNLDITHHQVALGPDLPEKSFPGNYHEFLLRQPGGSKSENPVPPLRLVG